jgi:serine/threonine-protein kinase
VVVKELKPELSDDETYVTMFLDEARLAARLTHPNVVQTNEVSSEPHHYAMIMEFLDGRSLHRATRHPNARGERLSIGAHLRVIAEALLGLHYAHELREFDGEPLGIVHRDVSPLNVFVTFDGQAKVLDFGIAKTADSSLETKTGVLKGRVAYMAPEQAWGSKVDRRADVYSAGVMLWEAAARRRLWKGYTDIQILSRIRHEGAALLRSVRPDAPEDLEKICARAMATSPEDRYPTAADLLSDLEAHLARRPDALPMREIGAWMSDAFAEERRTMNRAIEETLAHTRGGLRSGVMPTFEAHVVGSHSGADALSELSGAMSDHLILTPSNQRVALFASDSPPAADVARSTPPDEHSSAARARVAIAAAGATVLVTLIIVLATALFAGSRASNATASSPSLLAPSPPATEPAESAPIAAPPPVVLTLDRQPAAPSQPVAWQPGARASRATKHATAHDNAATSVSASEPPPSAPPPTSQPTTTAPVGHAPLRPILTSSPYGAP